MKAVSEAIFNRAATQFFVTLSKSEGAVWADESIRNLCKQFQNLFLSGQRLSFP